MAYVLQVLPPIQTTAEHHHYGTSCAVYYDPVGMIYTMRKGLISRTRTCTVAFGTHLTNNHYACSSDIKLTMAQDKKNPEDETHKLAEN